MDKINFELFEARRPRETPTIIVQSNKYLAINTAAYQALGCVKYVKLLFDPVCRVIALRPFDFADNQTYPILSRTGKRFTPGRICAVAFCTHYDIPTGIKVEAKMVKGLLVAALPARSATS